MVSNARKRKLLNKNYYALRQFNKANQDVSIQDDQSKIGKQNSKTIDLSLLQKVERSKRKKKLEKFRRTTLKRGPNVFLANSPYEGLQTSKITNRYSCLTAKNHKLKDKEVCRDKQVVDQSKPSLFVGPTPSKFYPGKLMTAGIATSIKLVVRSVAKNCSHVFPRSRKYKNNSLKTLIHDEAYPSNRCQSSKKALNEKSIGSKRNFKPSSVKRYLVKEICKKLLVNRKQRHLKSIFVKWLHKQKYIRVQSKKITLLLRKRKSDVQLPTVCKRKCVEGLVTNSTTIKTGNKINARVLKLREGKKTAKDQFEINKQISVNPSFKELNVFSRKKLMNNVFKLQEGEPKLINKLAYHFKGSLSFARVRAKSLLSWCLVARKRLICNFRKLHENLRTTCETKLLLAKQNKTLVNLSEVILGPSKHCSSTESFFYDVSYKPFSSVAPEAVQSPLVISESGVVMNIFPETQKGKKSFQWKCGSICNVDQNKSVARVYKIFKKLAQATIDKHMVFFLRNMNQCNNMCSQICKKGHSLSCRLNNGNNAPLVTLMNLMHHYPQLYAILRNIQSLKKTLHEIDDLDFGLYKGFISKLEAVANKAKLAGGEFKAGKFNFNNEQAVIDTYLNSFVAYNKEMNDLPTNYCFSCERLCFRRNLVEKSRMRCLPENQIWKEVVEHSKNRGVSLKFICIFCLSKIRLNQLPSVSTLNKLEVPTVPPPIMKLNKFEKIFIQRAKAFQVVTKMGTVARKNIPAANLVPKVVGRTFHFPLPIEQTIKKILKPQQAIMPHQEFYILVRGLPTKQKKIWESLVNVSNILEALQWLKTNNALYAEIELPNSVEEFLDCLEEDDPDNPNALNELQNNTNQTHLESDISALLTQCCQSDIFYDSFTIFPVYDKRENKSATDMYQMVKIQGTHLDSKAHKLDALCFPDLYPFGENCFHEDRNVKLEFADYIKTRLLSHHPLYRLNIQYIFFLLNQVNIRQLASGIYQILNITREKLTAGEFLEKLAAGDLERDMSCIFRQVRNTEEFWKKPRCQIFCMIENYGPPTFFLTLSPADYNDKELENFLREVNGQETAKTSLPGLIAKDPVSVSRFYNQKLHAMLEFLSAPGGPLGVIEHYVWRREYQGRGTQHFHILLWVRDAPVLGISSSDEVAKFVQNTITCTIPDKKTFPELYQKVMNYQQHRCNSYCQRLKRFNSGAKKVCRFGFPRPITDKLILRDVPTAIAGRRNLMANSRLYDLPRKDTEVRTNDYNIAVLLAWTGNSDLQFVGENSAIIGKYISKYQTKPEKSHMTDVFDDINSTKSVNSRLWNIGLRGLSNRECGALEAADTLLSIPLFGTDKRTSIKWIDVSLFRSRKVKTKKEIENLDPNTTDLFCPSIIDTHYPNRPEDLEDLCLYDYVKDFDIIKVEPKRENTEYYPYLNYGFLRKRKFPHLINHYHIDVHQRPEQYFYSLLLLFKPWRTISELKGSFDSYAEAFQAEKDLLQNAMMYHEKLGDIKAANEAVTKLVEEKSKEFQLTVINKSNESNSNADNDACQFQNFEAAEVMQEFRAAAQDDEEDLSSLEGQLNSDQLRVYNYVQAGVLSDSPLRHFVSGVGGTGKSFLIRVISMWVKKILKKDVAITAPTGIAAFNINGFTIHRILQLPIEHGKSLKYTRLSDTVLNVLRIDMKDVILVIIDEISMVSSLMLTMIHLRLTEIFDTFDKEDGYFGSINILVLGDLLQLPPVTGNSPFISLSKKECEKHFATMGSLNLWKELFTYDELLINMRQKSDESFCELLANIRLGFCSEENLNVLLSRQIKFSGNLPENRLKQLAEFILNHNHQPICLLPTKLMCETLNKSILSLLPAENIILIAEDSIDSKSNSKAKAIKKLKEYEDDCSRTAGLDKVIIVKVGARIMLKRNIDVTKGYVNGAIGTVLNVKNGLDRSPKSLQLQMKDDILVLEPVKCKFEILPGVFVYRKQFPISIAYGITIHKSQGLSLDFCVIDIGNKIFSCGQSYVALSRVKTLDGLFMINIDPRQIKAQTKGLQEYNRLRSKVPHLKSRAKEVRKTRKSFSIKDQVWAPGDALINVVEGTPSPTSRKTYKIPAFENKDNVSCYANATMQCLLSLEPLRSTLRRSVNNDALKILAHAYCRTKTTLSSEKIRSYLGMPYTQSEQQDAQEFLNALINRNALLRESTSFTESITRKCDTCDFHSDNHMNSFMLHLPVVPGEKSITKLLSNAFSWSLIPDSRCQSCGNGKYLERTQVLNSSHVLIIHLLLWNERNGQWVKNSKHQMTALPSTQITIAENSYKLYSALFHHGLTMKHGHYTAIVQSERQFILADDSKITESRWPRGSQDAYLLFYRKM